MEIEAHVCLTMERETASMLNYENGNWSYTLVRK